MHRLFVRVLTAVVALGLLSASTHAVTATSMSGDAKAGAKLAQSSGCEGCHGAGFTGASGPKLVGIEKRRSAAQIADSIKNPKAPMPNFGFNDKQIADIVAFVSGLDGGTGKPSVRISPSRPTESATVLVTFPGEVPSGAQVEATMQMGTMSHGTGWIPLHKTADPHVMSAKVHFTMGGAWTIRVKYGSGQELVLPLNVNG